MPDENTHLLHPNRHPRKHRETGPTASRAERPENTNADNTSTALEMISSFDRNAFERLARHPADVCLSLYLQTAVPDTEPAGQSDRHALKRLLRQSRRSLEEMRIRDVIDDILSPAESLLHDDAFWREPAPGLALFLAPDHHSCCQLPFDPGTCSYIHTSFIPFPIASLLNAPQYFYLLVLSQDSARLYRTNAYHMERMDIPEMPKGVADVVHLEEKGGSGVFRSSDGTGSGANYHGVGAGGVDKKTNISAYFREVNRTLKEKLLGREHAPLILAGVDYLLPIYRENNTYPQLVEQQITGNFDHGRTADLFRQAREKMASRQLDQWKTTIGHDLDRGMAPVSSFPQDVIKSAYEGKVRTLFVDRASDIWGQYNVNRQELVIHESRQPGDDDLTNQAVVQTILHGGVAYVDRRERLPANAEMTAILRYS